MFLFLFYPYHILLQPPPITSVSISLIFESFFPFRVVLFPPPCFNFIFFRKDFFFFSSFFFLFALYINEIGFFCSPMEDNHSSNCHLIAKFHRTVKGRNTGERALKKCNGFYLYICVSASDLLASSLPLPVISCSFFVLFLQAAAKTTFFLLIVSNRNIKIKVVFLLLL